ncbi:MAG TPA: hypothetical protein VH724_05800 [Candidatus Angelobacter sp.]|nr:hypothetical protein [Candidatus Angelobacter sp.]
MKKSNQNNGMRAEYDFAVMKGGIRGKHTKRYREGANLALLEPDVAVAFPNDKAVNQALRGILNIARDVRTSRPTNKSVRPPIQRRPRSKRG